MVQINYLKDHQAFTDKSKTIDVIKHTINFIKKNIHLML